MTLVTQTALPYPVRRGKVRDVYDLDDRLLLVATDRISAFDAILSPGIPDKGIILTQISNFWFKRFDDVENHLIETDFDRFPPEIRDHETIRGRSVLVRKCDVVPVECVARGYLIGSGLKDYDRTGTVCGIDLPPGLVAGSRLNEVIFTPATKAEEGHDENIAFEDVASLVGERVAANLREITIDLYSRAAAYALERGIIIADTKFEFGLLDDEIIWIDEALTPDSSRFWPVANYQVGVSPPSFDKQFVRDYLETTDWNKLPPAPTLPDEIVDRTRAKYLEAHRILTGTALA